MSNPLEKLQQLENIEREISSALHSAGQALTELSREKISAKQVENHSTHFLKTLESVENGLAKHISYLTQVSTSHPHEGSSYAAQKDLQMTLHRFEHVRSRLAELERMRGDNIRMQPGMQMQRGLSLPEGAIQRTLSQSGQGAGIQRALSMDIPMGGMQRNFSHQDPH